MKKIIAVLIMLTLLFSITGCGGPKTYKEISFEELNKKIDAKEDFILFIGSETCSACSAYKITLNKVIEKNKVEVNYIDISKLSDDENSDLLANFYFSSTPTTVFVEKGKEKDTNDRLVGAQKYSKVVKKFKEKGYIKE